MTGEIPAGVPLRASIVFVDEKRKESHVSETKARTKWHLKLILGGTRKYFREAVLYERLISI